MNAILALGVGYALLDTAYSVRGQVFLGRWPLVISSARRPSIRAGVRPSKAEILPTHIRAPGVGLPHALVTATFGGFTEPLAPALKKAGDENVFFWYVTGCIALTFPATLAVCGPVPRFPPGSPSG